MRRRLGLLAVLGVTILLGWGKPAFSQVGASSAQLNGSVRDESGGSVARATVTAREIETNRTYTAVSNDNGLYLFRTGRNLHRDVDRGHLADGQQEASLCGLRKSRRFRRHFVTAGRQIR